MAIKAQKPKVTLSDSIDRCTTCGGAGRLRPADDEPCPACKGSGRKPYPERANRLK